MKRTIGEVITILGGNPYLRTQNVNCPSHDDGVASLTLTIADNGRRLLVYCHAGCNVEEICAAVGLTIHDLSFDDEAEKNEGWKDSLLRFIKSKDGEFIKGCRNDTLRIAGYYDFTDSMGNYLYSRIRFEGNTENGDVKKTMRYGRIDLNKSFCRLGYKGEKKLYGLKELASQEPAKTVFYVEGEKDVETLWGYGLLAVTAGSVSDWKPHFATLFTDRDVVICGDSDSPGQRLVDQVRNDLLPVTKSLRIIFPSKLPHGDVTDFLVKEGGTLESFMRMVEEAPVEKHIDLLPLQKSGPPVDVSEEMTDDEEIYLKRSDRGKPLNVLENFVEILRKDPVLKGKIQYNALDGRPQVTGMTWDLQPHPIRDDDLAFMRLHISDNYSIGNRSELVDAITVISREHSFHPVRELLKSLEWDGKSRIKDLLPIYLGAERSDYTTAVTQLLLHGAIQRVYNPGVKFDLCVVLQGSQGCGKSTLCRFLALDDDWFTDSIGGDLGDVKKTFEAMRGRWIVELGEMVAVRRTKDVETIKSFLSRQVDVYRLPYGIYPDGIPRQQVFIATSNKQAFLPNDPTGNRRFIPLICNVIPQEKHPLKNEGECREYIRQCYAEAIVIGERDGWMLNLPASCEETLRAVQEESTPEDTTVGMIQKWLDEQKADTIVCSRMIYDKVFNTTGAMTPTSYELADIAETMNLKIDGWVRYKGKSGTARSAFYRFDDYGKQRAWEREESVYSLSTPPALAVDKIEDAVDKNEWQTAELPEDVPF